MNANHFCRYKTKVFIAIIFLFIRAPLSYPEFDFALIILLSSSDGPQCPTLDNVAFTPISVLPDKKYCSTVKHRPYVMLIYVRSVPYEFDLRTAVRNTWGIEAKDLGIHLLFIFGKEKKGMVLAEQFILHHLR